MGIATGNFDEDDTLDVAVANSGENSVSVLLGDGSGSFYDSSDETVGSSPYGIVAGDFREDDDGDLDLAFTLSGDDEIGVLYNTGTGGFEDLEKYDVKDSPYGIVAGDFNDDTYLDLAVANNGEHYVSVLYNDQNGGFTDRDDIGIGSGTYEPFGIVAGDFDLDEDIDLAVTVNTPIPSQDCVYVLYNEEGVFESDNKHITGVGSSPTGIFTGIFAYNIAERLMVKNMNGAFAGIFNTRFGYQYDPESGQLFSELFCRYFWHGIHSKNEEIQDELIKRELGRANAYSKEMNKWRLSETIGLLNTEVSDSDIYRHLFYEITLFGDPQLALKKPSLFSGNHPASTPTQPLGLGDGLPSTKYTFSTSAIDEDGDQLFYKWDWDDGTHTCWLGPYDSNETVNASHKWLSSSPQKYYVRVKARDTNGSEGEWSQLKRVVIILGSDFYVCPSIYSLPSQTVYFYDNSSGYFEIVNWSWDLGDGNISYERNTSHTYPTEGVYNVTLTVTDNQSNEVTSYQLVYIDSIPPEINNVSNDPDTVGFGYNITITAELTDNISGIDIAKVNITYPDSTTGNFTINNTGNDTYQYVFSDTWKVGQYNYTIWVFDHVGNSNSSSGHSFNVSAQATISVCTIKDDYGNNETVNLTDPPPGSPGIGYELLDGGDVLHIWNHLDSYYFDTNSGIQLTNHYNEYWSHNVLMLGYYHNDVWNLIYRTDELSGFSKNIDSDNESYVNVTIWKDLSYNGYDFRLAIRYYLGVDDNELTVIPYIKNIDNRDIPYVLGFGWEMKDIQIGMTTSGDYINVNRSSYYLDQTLDNVYTDLLETVFYLKENVTSTSTKSLYLKWNQSLTYKLQVKSREGQYNAPVTLFVRIGTLNEGQEKYTRMYWYDADQAIYYFNNYSTGEVWESNPGFMVDGSTSNFASTTIDGDIELCNGNNCSGADMGTISKVELRANAYYTGGYRDLFLRPVFNGTTDGESYRILPVIDQAGWSPWIDITNDPFAPQSWSWSDVENLDCDVEAGTGMFQFTLYCSKVEIWVTYTPYSPSEISNPYPSNGSIGVSLTPTLNITVSDPDGDSMNITWLSNSNGSWVAFGTNNSVGNGTYHQIMSNASVNGQWWYWKVNVTDGLYYNESSVFKFYTGYQSKIKNTGSTNFSGYLLIQVQYYDDEIEEWVVADDTVNESSPRSINWDDPYSMGEPNLLALDTIFNGLVNTQNLSEYGSGTYRIYAAFRDPDGNILKCDDETELMATYEFEVTFQ